MPDPIISQTLRLYSRYQLEVVEALNLCPWAKRAREENRVRVEVCPEAQPDRAAILARVDDCAQNPGLEIGLLLFPRLHLSRLEFERFVAELVASDAQRQQLSSPPFAFAAFHPAAELDNTKPDRLIPFWRRSPDPTIQLVRLSALERVRRADPPGTQFIDVATFDFSKLPPKAAPTLRQKVSQANQDTLHEAGVEAIEQRFRAIHRDRQQTHLELGLSPSPWESACD